MSSSTYDNGTGGPIHRQIPPGDTLERLVCNDCGFINYINPKIIVGAVCTWKDKFLLCRRSIAPRIGYWTMPAGFMEEGETALEGAKREAKEEACTDIQIDALLGVYNVARLSQVHLIYRAKLVSPIYAPGIESTAVELFEWENIPWENLAFPSVHWALSHYKEVEGKSDFAPLPEGSI
ncbi:NUDIX hydrolase [Alphaproteobacteria bacterium]|nr:NUDIX hydrolase [Alphaproteobacteria bacterium]